MQGSIIFVLGDKTMYRVIGKKVVAFVLTIVMLLALSFLASGCDSSLTLQSKMFYKGENGDREYLSREANPGRTYSLSWGDAQRPSEQQGR